MGTPPARTCAVAWYIALLSWLSGCVSYGSHLSASPLPEHTREVSLNADVLIVDRGLGPQPLPNPELGYRRSINPSLDWGGRINAGSLETNLRWGFAGGVVRWALVPGLGLGFVPVTNRDTGLFNSHLLLSLLSGVRLGQRSELVLAARGALTYAFPLTLLRGEPGEDTLYYLAGGALGFRFPVGEHTFLFPELDVLRAYDTQSERWLFPTLQGGVALQFD
ncbi:MAG TPA: hypothetical protein VHB79_35735 [Polyangiaceae bacterium]|nr:hypothetical protein [Polyangiaceae bacterium]